MQAWSSGAAAGLDLGDAWPPQASPTLPMASQETLAPEPPPIIAAISQATDATATQPLFSLPGGRTTRPARQQYRSQRLTVTVSLAVVAAVVLVGLTIFVAFNRSAPVDHSGQPTLATIPKAPLDHKTSATITEPIVSALETKIATNNVTPTPSVETPAPQPQNAERPAERAVVDNSPPPAVTPPIERRYPRPSPDREIVSFVNAELTRGWQEAGVKPTPAVSDAEWCQRLFAEVVGRSATADELKALADDKSATRREKLVDRLLTDTKYADEYARHWAAIWTNVLVGRTQGQRGAPANRDELRKHLQSALAANKPYDELVQELLTATGSTSPSGADYNPAVNFLLDGIDDGAVVPTARISRVLLGHQLQCAQCHAHPSQG